MKKIALLLAILLAGCKGIGPDYQRAPANLPASYGEADTNASAQADVLKHWWTHYGDEQLNKLVARALENNTDIALATARIEEADAKMREVGASILPAVTLSASGQRNRVTELGAFPPFGGTVRNDFKFGLNTSYEIDFWGKIARSKESARASALSSRAAKDTVELSLIGLVASNYLQLRGLDAQMAITQDNLKSRAESLALTQRRLAGGVASALEVSQAEVAVSNLDAQIIELGRLRALSLHQLAILTGDLDLTLEAADLRSLPMPPTPPAGLPSALLESRPDVRQAEQNLIAQNAQIGIAKAALYPSISLTGQLGGESLLLKNILKSGARIWTLGLGLDLPIFDAGRRNSQVEQATAKQKQTLAQYQAAIQNAFIEVNDALVNRRLNAEREQALTKSQNSAKTALNVAENRYKAGYSAYLDVLDAQRVYHEAAVSAIQARQATFIATVALFKALGSGWKDQPLATETTNTQPASTQP